MKRRTRWLKIGLAGLLLLIIIGIYLLVPGRDNLAYLAAVGDKYDVEILRDSWGVPHVFGRTDADAAYGLGYAHSEDDFQTIQESLAVSRGVLARYYGQDSAPVDYLVGLFRIWDYLDAGYESELAPETRAVVEAYADGVNHYAALHPEEAWPGLFPVTGKDIVAGFMVKTPFFFGIDSALGELFEDERQRPVSDRPGQAYDLPLSTWSFYGSNTFAVGPGRSADGSTFLAVNSHQPWTGPVAWYEAHVHSDEGWDAVGGTFPGAPLILVGHNRDLGWAFTVNSPDLYDVYVLTMNPDNPNQYMFDGEWRDLEVWEVPIEVKLFGRISITVKQEALWSVYGPTVRRPHGVYSLRYASMGGESIPMVEQWYQLNRAGDFESWRTALADGPLPMFNAGYADRAGNIYYVYNARLPLRAEGYDWEQYLPGDTSATLWTEYLPFDLLPQVLNPASGFVQNSNSSPFRTTIGPGNPDPAAFSATFGIDTRMSNRSLRALELFGADESITFEEFISYKYDMRYSVDSDIPRFIERLTAGFEPAGAAESAGLALLADWDLSVDPDSQAAALLVVTLHFINDAPEAHINPSKLTESDVPDAVLYASYRQAVDVLMTNFGRVDVPWSEVNRIRRGAVDVGLGGGPDILHAVYGALGDDGRFSAFNGDGYVLLVQWAPDGSLTSYSIHQFGAATLRPMSPHYADQVPLFARRELRPVWFDEADIRANLERAYRPGE